jgi:hypothetical protein
MKRFLLPVILGQVLMHSLRMSAFGGKADRRVCPVMTQSGIALSLILQVNEASIILWRAVIGADNCCRSRLQYIVSRPRYAYVSA